MDKKPRPFYPQETHSRAEDTKRLIVGGWEKILHANRNDKKVGVAKLISENKL